MDRYQLRLHHPHRPRPKRPCGPSVADDLLPGPPRRAGGRTWPRRQPGMSRASASRAFCVPHLEPPAGRPSRRPPSTAVPPGSAGARTRPESVSGYALHTATVTDPGAPAVIEALAATPAPASSLPGSWSPLLRDSTMPAWPTTTSLLWPRPVRAACPREPLWPTPPTAPTWPSGNCPSEPWAAPPIFRLHRVNQAGRWAVRGHHAPVYGRPHCERIPKLTWLTPRLPEASRYSRRELDDFQAEVAPPLSLRDEAQRQLLQERLPPVLALHYDQATRAGGCE